MFIVPGIQSRITRNKKIQTNGTRSQEKRISTEEKTGGEWDMELGKNFKAAIITILNEVKEKMLTMKTENFSRKIEKNDILKKLYVNI